MLYIEWCLCASTLYLCWWKYGWRIMDMLKAVIQMYRKLEGFFDSPPTRKLGKCQDDVLFDNSFLNAPVTRTQFNLRTRNSSFNKDGSKSQCKQFSTFSKIPALSGQTRPICCSACTERDKTKLIDLDSPDLINCLDCDTREPQNPWYVRRFAFWLHFWRNWHVGRLFHMVSLKDLLREERINRAVEEVARQELKDNPNAGPLEMLIAKHAKRAKQIVANMRGKQFASPYDTFYVRFASWIIGKTLSRIYPRILARKSQLERIRQARASGYRIVYLPVHRSHVDYVLVSWVLAASGFRAPLVAAGDNLNIPIFNLMMKSVGGFFIKRRLDRFGAKRDVLYRAILYSYMERSILNDNDLEFFVEGGRTRTGKPCHPKGGLLNIAIDTMLTKKVDDLLIVPVNFTYEKLIEGNYVREQLGKPKVNESFASAALGLWNSMQQTKFGNCRIDFGRPFSVKNFLESYKQWSCPSRMISRMHNSDSSCSETDQNYNNNESRSRTEQGILDRHDFIDSLAQHVIYDGVQTYSLMSTNVISFLLLNKFRNGVSIEKLAEEMALLKEELILRNHDVDISGDMKEIINHGLTVLGPSLVSKKIVSTEYSKIEPSNIIILKPITILPNVIDLAYYSTCVTPIYALDAVIATSILYLAGKETGSARTKTEMSMTDADLVSTCLELCEILHHEFIFKPPCQTMEHAVRNTLGLMKSQGFLRFNYLIHSEESDEEVGFSNVDLIYVSNSKKNMDKFRFLHGLVRPILDTYSVSSFVLKRLVECEAQEKQLHMDMLAEVKCHLKQNFITYGESLALDPIRNFVKVLLDWHVLESSSINFEILYNLEDTFDNEKSVYDVIRKIGKFQV